MDPNPINTPTNPGHTISRTTLPSVIEHGREIAHDARDAVASRPVIAMVAAGAIGFALGAVIFKARSRRNDFGRFGSVQRAAEIASSGAVNTLQSVRKRLRQEGYSPSELQGQAKRYVRQLVAAARGSLPGY